MNLWVKKSRRILKAVLVFPISPAVFALGVEALRFLGLLPQAQRGHEGPVRQILVSHPYSSVGDAVLLLPLLERIRNEWPTADIDIVVGDSVCDLFSGVNGIRHRFLCDSHRSRIPILGNYIRLVKHLLRYRRQMMPHAYDLAIAPRWGSIMTSDAIYLSYLTGATQRIGYSSAVDGGNRAMDRLLTKSALGGWHEHETIRSLKLLDRAGLTGEEIKTPFTVDRPIQALLNLANRKTSEPMMVPGFLGENGALCKYAVISPGATKLFNLWPTPRLAEVIRELHRRQGLQFLIIGSAVDAAICQELAEQVPVCAKSIAGTTSLKQVAQILSMAQLFIGMDSGTAHIAGAVGIPTLVLYPFPSSYTEEHPGSPVRFRPCGPHVKILQPSHGTPPCFPTCTWPGPHCILQIATEEVVSAAINLLGTMDDTIVSDQTGSMRDRNI